jgi:hypothetical protein
LVRPVTNCFSGRRRRGERESGFHGFREERREGFGYVLRLYSMSLD